jgi:antitoxin (DNA-binding transcriptional repressor) of toxin-antitoxin stability system
VLSETDGIVRDDSMGRELRDPRRDVLDDGRCDVTGIPEWCRYQWPDLARQQDQDPGVKASTRPRLTARVMEWARVIIANAGQLVGRLVPTRPGPKRRVFGQDRGKLSVPEDFNATLPASVLRDFEG